MSGCLFCRIVTRAISAAIVVEDDQTLAFEDVNPQAPVHVLVIPKRHIRSIGHADEHDTELLGRLVETCVHVARRKGLEENGYRVLTNIGPNAGQSVFHLHWHVLGGRHLGWPPG